MKKIIKVFLSFVIVLLMLFLTISFNLNKVIVDGVIKEIIITKVIPKKVNNPNISEEEETKLSFLQSEFSGGHR